VFAVNGQQGVARIITKEAEVNGVFIWDIEAGVLRRRYTKGALWEWWFRVNWMKLKVFRIRCRCPRAHWERRMSGFLEQAWRAVVTDGIDLLRCHVIYGCTVVGTQAEYIGQSSAGFRTRVATHAR
jgi:hypothetical protein